MSADMVPFSLLACKLPDDDADADVEASLLKRWGFKRDFIHLSRATGFKQDGCPHKSDTSVQTKESPVPIRTLNASGEAESGPDLQGKGAEDTNNGPEVVKPSESGQNAAEGSEVVKLSEDGQDAAEGPKAAQLSEVAEVGPNAAKDSEVVKTSEDGNGTANRPELSEIGQNAAENPEAVKMSESGHNTAKGSEVVKLSEIGLDAAKDPEVEKISVSGHDTVKGPESMKPSESGRDPALSDEVRYLYDQAEMNFRSGQFCDSLIYIDEALESCDHAMLWTLKTRIMIAMGDYLEALKAVAMVKAEERSKELCFEGAMALHKLGLRLTAEKWLKRILMDRKDERPGGGGQSIWTGRAFLLFQAIRNDRIYGPLIKGKPIEIRMSKQGRDVLTTEKINKGDVIFSELPELLEQSIATCSITACAHCGMSLAKPGDIFPTASAELLKTLKKMWPKRPVTKCRSCDRVVFCSETCRQEAWDGYHQVICPSSPNSTSAMLYDVRKSFRAVIAADGSSWQGWWNAEFSPTMLAKMWATILCCAKKLAGDEATPARDDWLKAFSYFEKYSSNPDDPASEAVPKMFELMSNIFKRSKFQRFDITEKDFNRKYNQVLTNNIRVSDVNDPAQQFVDSVNQNPKLGKKIGKYFQGPLPKAEFNGLFPLASCINHSCMPNAELVSGTVDGKLGVIVKARKEIAAKEEVLISYVNPAMSRKERRETLLRKYKFWCQCIRCLHEGNGPDTCTYCGKKSIELSTACEDIGQNTCSESPHVSADEDTLGGTRHKPEAVSIDDEHVVSDADTRSEMMDKLTDTAEEPSVSPVSEELNSVRSTPGDGNWCQNESDSKTVFKSHNNEEAGIDQSGSSQDRTILADDMTPLPAMNNSENENTTVDAHLNDTGIVTPDPNKNNDGKEADASSAEARGDNLRVTDHEKSGATEDRDILSGCGACQLTDTEVSVAKKFPHCSKCGRAWYCSSTCQKEAWKKGHKKICGKF